jgi:hypothetical protein
LSSFPIFLHEKERKEMKKARKAKTRAQRALFVFLVSLRPPHICFVCLGQARCVALFDLMNTIFKCLWIPRLLEAFEGGKNDDHDDVEENVPMTTDV